MRVELDLDDCDNIVIAALQQSAMYAAPAAIGWKHPDDVKYYKEYKKHVQFVLKHFGSDLLADGRKKRANKRKRNHKS